MIVDLIVLAFVAYAVYLYAKRRTVKPSYQGKTVWITGASSGIGQYLAYQFNRLGASLIISARNEQELNRVKRSCSKPDQVQVVKLDMSDFDEVKKITKAIVQSIQKKGLKLDVVVQNAGISQRSEFRQYAFENHLSLFNVNVHGPVIHLKSLLEHMMMAKSGQIVAISSVTGKLSPAYRASYAGSKHAIIGIFDSLRTQLHPYGIKVTTIMPGYIRTNISVNSLSGGAGQKFGSTDKNIANGMAPQKFAKQAVAAIFNGQSEVQISQQWLSKIGIVFRNLCPDLVFYMLLKNQKNQTKSIAQANKKQ